MFKNTLLILNLIICNLIVAQNSNSIGTTLSTMSTVYFDTDSDVLSQDAQDVLTALFLSNKESIISEIILTGYCDNRGSSDYNIDLAKRRNASVKYFFDSQRNFNPSIYKLIPRGEISKGDLEYIGNEYRFNRRVQINVTYEYPALDKEREIDKELTTSNNLESYDVFSDSLIVNQKLVFNNLIFHPGTHRLRDISYPVMDSIINSLMIHKKYEIEIQGHICCNPINKPGRDIDTGQWNLSTARAEQIKRYFVKYNLDPTRFTTIGKMANFKTGKGDFYDRRVELHITAIREKEQETEKQKP